MFMAMAAEVAPPLLVGIVPVAAGPGADERGGGLSVLLGEVTQR
jgi:hypothetical protein